MVTGIILAGGSGTRTGWEMPKQFVEINGKPLIVYALEEFQKSSYIDNVLIVCKKGYNEILSNIIERYGITKLIKIVEGGETHQQSLTNALEFINSISKSSDDIVVIHNANRPLVTQEIIEDSVDVCIHYGCGISALSCVDSMMYSENGIESNVFLERSQIIRAQSPQSYKLKEIHDVYQKAKKEGIKDSYECNLMTRYGYKIYFSKGSENNVKLTKAEDLILIKSLLKQKKEKENIEQRKRIQTVCKEITDVIFDICKKNDLKCYLAYGTLLGAVREKAFIPWDWDIDLMMPMNDYKKLEEILKTELPKEYFLQTFETDRYYGLNWMKVRKNNTTCVDGRWHNIPCHNGIDVDIFQISRVPDGKIARMIWLFLYRVQWSILESFIVEAKPELIKKKKKKKLYNFLIKVPYNLRYYIAKKLDPIAFGRGEITTKEVIIGTKNVYYPSEWFTESVEVEFEKTYYAAPKEYDNYLTKRYGDYMIPPKEAARNIKKFKEVSFEYQSGKSIKPNIRKEGK